MRKLTMAALLSAIAAAALPAGSLAARNPSPSGTGKPSQSCQEITAAGGRAPGNAASSPGSPFNEPGPGNLGGTGGQHYSPNSQYDVACYQVSQH